jgi:hypothetical protein
MFKTDWPVVTVPNADPSVRLKYASLRTQGLVREDSAGDFALFYFV